jgi:hypothetical protein
MQVCPLSYLPKTPLKALVVGYEKKANSKTHLVRYNTHWVIKWIIWGTYLYFTKLTKLPDRRLIKEWMTVNSVITILSCNRPRTWKGYKPYNHQGKWVDKMPTYLNCDGILCYRHVTCELYRHRSNSWSTTKYLAICSGRAKVKLVGFVGGHYCAFRTANYSLKTGEINKLWHMHILWPCSTCFRRKHVL